jgi:hypothetical protein
MNERIKELASKAWPYADLDDLTVYLDLYGAKKFAELILIDSIQTLRNNGYDDAAECLHDVHFGMDDPV